MATSIPTFIHEKLWWGLLLSGILLALARLFSVGLRSKNLPPGPRPLPIMGNLHQLPKKDVHLQYQKWAAQYGPIFSLSLGQQRIIVLTKGDYIKRLFDKRSANYADRQQLYVRELYEDTHIVTRGYDDMWRLERKLYHSLLGVNVVKKYIPYQSTETLQLCIDLLRDPEDFFEHIARTTTSIASCLSYGFRIGSAKSPVMQEMFKNGKFFFSITNRSKFLDWYPSLRPLFRYLPRSWRPLASEATRFYHEERKHFKHLFEAASERQEMPSFAQDIAKSQKQWQGDGREEGGLLTDQAAAYVAGIAFEAGADTTKNTLIGFVLAMVLFADVQEEAQREVDEVVGEGRVPRIEDLESLPYVRGVVKESLRWLPTTINGVLPHAASKDDNIDGYDIPAGTGLINAIWSVNNDPELFPDPRRFDPTRHNVSLRAGEAAQASDIKDRDHWTFGAGRRICPGMHLAENSLSLAIVRMLWAFKFEREREENGKEIEVDPAELTQSIAVCPLPFRCRIIPRRENRTEVLKKEWEKARESLDATGNYRKSPL